MATTADPSTDPNDDSKENKDTETEIVIAGQGNGDFHIPVNSASNPSSTSFDIKLSQSGVDQDFAVDVKPDTTPKKSISAKRSKRSKRDKFRDYCAPPFLSIFFVLNIYAMVDYILSDDDSPCKVQVEDGDLTVSPDVFTFMAGICSISMLVVMWCSYRASNARDFVPPRNQREKYKAADKGERCHTFCKFSLFFLLVKIVLGCAGLWMWFSEFSDDCRQETIGMIILFWSAFQFSFLCLSAALIGFLGYMAAQEGAGSLVEDALGD